MKVRENLKIGSIFNFIVAGIHVLSYGVSGSIYSLISLAMTTIAGIYLYSLSYREDYEIKKMRWLVIVFAILLIPFNLVSTIIYFMASDKIVKMQIFSNAPPKDEMSEDAKRLDFILKLGVGMVVLSGVIFATTNWDMIPNVAKTALVLVLGLLFLLLYYISKQYIKVEQSTRMYYLLSMIFIWLGLFTIKFVGPVADVISLMTKYNFLFYAMSAIVAAVMLYIAYMVFNSDVLRLLTIFALTICASFVGIYFEAGRELIALIACLVLVLELLFNKESELLNSIALPVAMFIGILNPIVCIGGNRYIIMLNVILLLVLLYLVKDKKFGYLTSIIIPINLFFTLFNVDVSDIYEYGTIMLSMTSLSLALGVLFILTRRLRKDLFIYISSFISVVFLVVGHIFFQLVAESMFLNLYNASLLLVLGIIGVLTNRENKTLLALSSLLFIPIIYSGLYYLGLDYTSAITIVLIATLALNIFMDSRVLRIANIVLLVFAFFTNAVGTTSLVCSIAIVFASIINFLQMKDEPNVFRYSVFIFTELMIYSCLTVLAPSAASSFDRITLEILGDVASAIIYILLGYYYRKDKFMLITVLMALLLPILNIIDVADIGRSFEVMIASLYLFIATIFICKYIIEKDDARVTFALIMVIVVLFRCIFALDTILTFYLIIVSLVLIIIGLNDRKYYGLTITGIVALIVTVFNQIRDYLEYIPFWLYLLVIGLSLIGIVTYLQFKRK